MHRFDLDDDLCTVHNAPCSMADDLEQAATDVGPQPCDCDAPAWLGCICEVAPL
jgi:hypothetical protein